MYAPLKQLLILVSAFHIDFYVQLIWLKPPLIDLQVLQLSIIPAGMITV